MLAATASIHRKVLADDHEPCPWKTHVAARVLVVEDDRDVVQVVRAYLEREGFAVEVATDGLRGLDQVFAAPPDLIVLDWMLPGIDGLEFLKRLRREHRTPVILLTARGAEADRVLGLEFGADDYVPKPFSPRELIARVRAVLRRVQPDEQRPEAVVTHRGLAVDPGQRRVTSEGRTVDVTTLEFDLLYAMVRAPGRVFTRQELLDRVWGEDFVGVDRVVDVHISNLRQKLAELGASDFIGTVRGVGYRVA